MEKVKVSKEIFEAFEKLEELFLDGNIKNEVVISTKINKGFMHKLNILNHIDFELFLNIIMNGYELEKTEEERKQELFVIYNNNSKHGHIENMCFNRGVIKTLEVLGIKVRGINV